MVRESNKLIPPRTRMHRCENCEFFAPDEKECRKGTPGVLPSQQGIIGLWPPTRPDKWCGQWAPLPADAYETEG